MGLIRPGDFYHCNTYNTFNNTLGCACDDVCGALLVSHVSVSVGSHPPLQPHAKFMDALSQLALRQHVSHTLVPRHVDASNAAGICAGEPGIASQLRHHGTPPPYGPDSR